jgi:Helix-turn-helix domain
MNTATSKVLTALENGHQLTAAQISSRYKVANPHDVIYKLRNKGYEIMLGTHVNSKGAVTRKYSLA